MQVSFDPMNQDDRDAVANMIEALDGGKPKKASSKKPQLSALPAAPIPVAPAPVAAPIPVAPAPVAPAPVAPAPAAPAPVAPAPAAGATKLNVIQAVQAYTMAFKPQGAMQRLSEFARTYGIAEPMSIDKIPESHYAVAVDFFKVQ